MTAVRAFRILATTMVVATTATVAQAGTLKVLCAFQGPGGGDGQLPYAAPFMDSKGDLYGTTYYGGSHGLGIVYRLHRTKSGA